MQRLTSIRSLSKPLDDRGDPLHIRKRYIRFAREFDETGPNLVGVRQTIPYALRKLRQVVNWYIAALNLEAGAPEHAD